MNVMICEVTTDSGNLEVKVNPMLEEVMTRQDLAGLIDEAAEKLREEAGLRRLRKGRSKGKGSAKQPAD